MNAAEGFDFGNSSVAQGYDDVLVPILFAPWAAALASDPQWAWPGKTVVEVAAGTGVVTQALSDVVGSGGRIIASDINPEMLSLARKRCAESKTPIEFMETPAHPLAIDTAVADVVVCQQGYQFFPDRDAAASEMFRVLNKHGKAFVSTWLPVSEIGFAAAIVTTLRELGEPEVAELMRKPFDFMPGKDLQQHFENAGFTSVRVEEKRLPLRMAGGVADAVASVFATPIAPHLAEFSDEKRAAFRETLQERYQKLHSGTNVFGEAATNVLVATKGG